MRSKFKPGRSSNRSIPSSSRQLLVLIIMVISVVLTGCLNATVSLRFTEDDQVSGKVLLAVPAPPGQQPFKLRVPHKFGDRVHVEPYKAGERSGSKLVFNDLSFDEFERLGELVGREFSRYKFNISRAGTLVTVEGTVDLTPLADTDSSLVIEINTPGEVTTTTGQVVGGMMIWRPEAGEVTEFSATFQYADAAVAGGFGWAWAVGGFTFAVALLVATLAVLAHRRMRQEADQPAA